MEILPLFATNEKGEKTKRRRNQGAGAGTELN